MRERAEAALREALHEAGLDAKTLQVGPRWAGAEDEEEGEEEDYLEALADAEDHWMRSPAPLESALLSPEELAEALHEAGASAASSAGSSGGADSSSTGGAGEVPSSSCSTAAAAQQPGGARAGTCYGSEPLPTVTLQQWEAAAGGGGPCMLLDVRSVAERAGGGVPGSLSVPLEALTRERCAGWGGALVGVLETGDHRAPQACIRLRKVFHLEAVLLVMWVPE